MMISGGVVLGDGRYTLQRRLGAGGMASVWLAHDERLDRDVAIKVMADALTEDPQWAARFMGEARVAAAVAHPNVVSVFDYGVEDGHPFLVMAYVPGRDLGRRMKDGERPPAPAAELAGDLLRALGAVHAAGIVHRDVKAANVLVDRDGRALLADFGIARAEDATSLTQTGMVIGTFRYLAPELAAGHPASPASDLFAAGIVVREIATAFGPSEDLTRVADALTRPDPADRPASTAEALRILHGDADATVPMTAATRLSPLRGSAPDATAATMAHPGLGAHRPAPAAHPGAATARDAPGRPASRAPRGRRRVAVAVLALVVGLAIVLAVVLATGSSGPEPARVRSPAPAGTPVSEQVETMRSIVDEATRK